MRIIRESEMAKLEYVDDTGDNSLAMYLPDYYYDIFRNLVEVNRERTGRDLPFDGVLGAWATRTKLETRMYNVSKHNMYNMYVSIDRKIKQNLQQCLKCDSRFIII